MNISDNGLNLIKEFEGFRSNAYLCPANIWTLGFGSTQYLDGRRVKPGDRITKEEAEKLLRAVANNFAWSVKQSVKVPLTQNQLDALVSFVFNVGIGAFRSSTLLRKLNAGDYTGAANEFLRWDKATVNGRRVALAGLTRRRKAERALFVKP